MAGDRQSWVWVMIYIQAIVGMLGRIQWVQLNPLSAISENIKIQK